MVNIPQEENAVRAVLRNEITWICFIVVSVWGAVVWIILPIQALELGQQEINVQISQIQSNNNNIPTIVANQKTDEGDIKDLQVEWQTFIIKK